MRSRRDRANFRAEVPGRLPTLLGMLFQTTFQKLREPRIEMRRERRQIRLTDEYRKP